MIFTKNVALVKNKIKNYYEENLITSFDSYLKPQLEQWIQQQIIDLREQKNSISEVQQEAPNLMKVQVPPQQIISPENLVQDFI